jgi:hypothetical protein
MGRRYVDGRGLVNDVVCCRTPYCEFAMVDRCKHGVPHTPCGCEKSDVCAMTDYYCVCKDVKRDKKNFRSFLEGWMG